MHGDRLAAATRPAGRPSEKNPLGPLRLTVSEATVLPVVRLGGGGVRDCDQRGLEVVLHDRVAKTPDQPVHRTADRLDPRPMPSGPR